MSVLQPIDVEKHVAFILGLEQKTQSSDALYFTDHKRLSGVYWAISSLSLLKRLDDLPRDRILDYVMTCYNPTLGAFAGNTDQDAHLLYTLSGIQILAIYDNLSLIDVDKVVSYIRGLQKPDGSFAGDEWGEIDTRFSYCALLSLSILNRLDAVDVDAAVAFVLSCQNFDGGFGCIPGAESHAGQVFCCVGALALADALRRIDAELLGWWLCERQLPCGGFNGRPDKLEDVCYSWWVLASLAMLGKADWVDARKLREFILACQDEEDGGIADRPGDMADIFHTFFGFAGLSLMEEEGFEKIDPAFALAESVVARIGGG